MQSGTLRYKVPTLLSVVKKCVGRGRTRVMLGVFGVFRKCGNEHK
jgi:hypothetical protein